MDGLHATIVTWAVTGGMLTVIGFTIGTYVKVGKTKEELQIKMESTFQSLQQESKSKVDRVYTRLDDVKTNAETKFVSRDICKLLHEQQGELNKEIKKQLESMSKDIRALLVHSGVKPNGDS